MTAGSGKYQGRLPAGGSVRHGDLKWLNTLRALGVLLVLIYHFFPSLLAGGFIGVDIFFVVSGYLITSLLLREYDAAGRIDLPAFWRRRWRRLFPAICAMLLATLPLSLLISPDFRVDAARQSAAALSWTTNFYELLTGQSYEAQLLPHLFIHTWTLSVEMQYYLIWAAVVAVLLVTGRARFGIIITAAVFFAVSAALMRLFAEGADDPSAAYMSTASHFFPLMAGSAFASVGGFSPAPFVGRLAGLKYFKPVSLACVAAGLAFIIWASIGFSFGDGRVYAWGIAAVSLISGAIILVACAWQGLAEGKTAVSATKIPPRDSDAAAGSASGARAEWKLTNYIGLRSYSIYLFHWPLMILCQHIAPALGVPQPSAQLVGSLAAIPLTFAAAELSYRHVEQRFRLKSPTPALTTGASGLRGEEAANAKPAVARRTYRRRFVTAIAICAIAVLCVISARAIATAPLMSGIESDLKYGAMTLDVMDMNEYLEGRG
ncbi:MAG: acyltransferase [Clostridiales Family XIII bacterium]|jgi:peptidoglycan/LPS O-acetylase OafA/YrhL|nr:acyltransferase [Clostridiales Family XIII bacterium]